jgi:DNA polymerase-3 subunit gamma/tau
MSADPDDLAPEDGRGDDGRDDDASADGSPTSDDPNQVSFLDAPAAAAPKSAEPAAAPAAPPPAAAEPAGEYRVLARKYRPQTFAELIGQQAMVRTLTNAFDLDRVHHAFILTGVRGVGKTTTARIVAKALNCVGPDGTGGPTIAPCGTCDNCTAIAADRHPDVMEMDAASRTGINDIREILDSVRYRPVLARYKVYIIDEVHMLSTQAFNGLLKTLEEPPGHVKFIFATTETRKVPVTVLSRCQRFDLRRVGADELMTHLGGVAAAVGASLDEGALRLIARAADGSVRDGLSLLDQAISAYASGGATASETDIRGMLGLADAGGVYDLFEAVMRGDAAAALGQLQAMYDVGADPLVVLRDLLELSHWITRVKLVPETADAPSVSETEWLRGREMAQKLPVSALSRAWQIALKGLGEAQAAPAVLPAVEMVLIRLAHAAELPTPGDIVRRLQGEVAAGAPAAARPSAPPAGAPNGGSNGGAHAVASASVAAVAGGGPTAHAQATARAAPAIAPQAQPDRTPDPKSFRDLVDLFGARKQGDVRNHLYLNVHLVAYEPGRLEFRPRETAPRDLAGQVLGCLRDWCGAHWSVSVSGAPGEATLAEQDRERAAAQRAAAEQHPVVRAALETFPGARIERVTALDGADDEALMDTETAIPPDDEIGEDDELLIDSFDEGYADMDRGYTGPDDGDEYP